MSQQAIFYPNTSAQLITATVLGIATNTFTILVNKNYYEASLAVSCLMQPQENDQVLVAQMEDDNFIILAILNRNNAKPAKLNLPHESTISCTGNLNLESAHALNMQSGKNIDLSTENLSLSAMAAKAQILDIQTLADKAKLCCNHLTNIGKTALSVFSSLTQSLDESKRVITGTDETHCNNSTLITKECTTTMSKNELSLSKETSRTDAKLIQLG